MNTPFQEVLGADPETLAGMLTSPEGEDASVEGIARRLRLHKAELVSAVGFNRAARTLSERLAVLGYPGFEALVSHRDLLFATDAYRRLSLRDVVAIYAALLSDPETLADLQDLIFDRLAHIEGDIDTKIDALIIESYKRELATLYLKGIVRRDFAGKRLESGNRGFRALGNEIKLILEAGLYSPAEILADEALHSDEKTPRHRTRLRPRDRRPRAPRAPRRSGAGAGDAGGINRLGSIRRDTPSRSRKGGRRLMGRSPVRNADRAAGMPWGAGGIHFAASNPRIVLHVVFRGLATMEAFLRALLPRMLGDTASFNVYPYQCKVDLLGKLPASPGCRCRRVPAARAARSCPQSL